MTGSVPRPDAEVNASHTPGNYPGLRHHVHSPEEIDPSQIIEVRDSRTGYLIPARYGMGVWPDGKIVGAPPPSPSSSPGNHLEKVTLTVLVFAPEWVSYERSRRVRHAKMREISARVFFVKISKSQDSIIYTILRFF